MPGTVDDFIQRFSSSKTMDDREASTFLDRFASTDPNDRDFDNDAMSEGATEYLGKLPDSEFQQAAQSAYASAPPAKQSGLTGTLLRALQNRGVSAGSLGGLFGQSGDVPSQLDPNQYAQLANFARREHPEAMREVVREQPWVMKAMGNPVLMGALGVVASRMMRSRMGPPAQKRARGLLGNLF